jgi:hypothetical protein
VRTRLRERDRGKRGRREKRREGGWEGRRMEGKKKERKGKAQVQSGVGDTTRWNYRRAEYVCCLN